MIKLVLILVTATAFAQGLASASSQPPLLIQDTSGH